MSFPRYPKYKDSGVEWWGEMPEDWFLLPAKRSFFRKKELNWGMKCENRLSLTLGGVVPRDLDDVDGLQASEFETYQIFFAKDLVFKLIDLQNIKTSRVGLVPEAGIMSPAYIRLQPNKEKVIPRYAYWFFTNLYNRCIFNELGGGVRQTITSEELLLLPFPSLSLSDQTRIAEFLDRETAKIDALVAEQERLIGLLKEKRQAVITHAVTKGLNPNAPMKPSGIEWSEEIPVHWGRTMVRHIVDEHKQGFYTKDEYSEEGTPLLRITDIREDTSIDFGSCPRLTLSENEKNQFGLSIGDFVFVRSGASIGKFGFVEKETNAIFGSYTIRFRFQKTIRRGFLKWAFQSSAFLDGLFSDLHGGAIVNVNADNIKNQFLPIPPVPEQETIAAYLDSEIIDICTLTTEAQRAIDLLQERRTALISAAVTGQIDLRMITINPC